MYSTVRDMFRGLTVLSALFALLFAWISPSIEAAKVLSFPSDNSATTSLGGDFDSDDGAASQGNAKDNSGQQSSDEDETDELAKNFDWLLQPLNHDICLVELGTISSQSLALLGIYHPAEERPPRV